MKSTREPRFIVISQLPLYITSRCSFRVLCGGSNGRWGDTEYGRFKYYKGEDDCESFSVDFPRSLIKIIALAFPLPLRTKAAALHRTRVGMKFRCFFWLNNEFIHMLHTLASAHPCKRRAPLPATRCEIAISCCRTQKIMLQTSEEVQLLALRGHYKDTHTHTTHMNTYIHTWTHMKTNEHTCTHSEHRQTNKQKYRHRHRHTDTDTQTAHIDTGHTDTIDTTDTTDAQTQ